MFGLMTKIKFLARKFLYWNYFSSLNIFKRKGKDPDPYL